MSLGCNFVDFDGTNLCVCGTRDDRLSTVLRIIQCNYLTYRDVEEAILLSFESAGRYVTIIKNVFTAATYNAGDASEQLNLWKSLP